MKEFYFKNYKNQVYFFFRTVNENSVDYDSWKKYINNKIDFVDPDQTFKKLLKFLKIKNKPTISYINETKVSIWESEEYRLIEFVLNKNDKNVLTNMNFNNIVIINNTFYCIIKKGEINEFN